MHPTTQRLFEALLAVADVNGWEDPGKAATYIGESQATVTNWRSRGVSKGGMLKACALLNVSPHWLATGEGEMQAQSVQNLSKPPPNLSRNASISDSLVHAGDAGKGKLVPVVGTARLGDNGFYEEISSMSGAGDGMVETYSTDPNAYALKVRGDSMYPSIRDGWFVIVEPGTAASPGDFVLLKLLNGQKMVKELIMQRHDGITVVSVNGDTRRSYGFDELDPHFGMQAVSAIVSPRKWMPQ